MHVLNPNDTGLVVGAFLGGWHLLWAILVAIGLGQALLDFVLWAHMIHVTWIVGPFEAKAAITLIILTSMGGFAAGYLFAWVWNKVHAE
jgi:hypothetical protein